MAERDGGTARYAAFLSYSHEDEAAARGLHRKLEGYRIPKRLAGTEGERGIVPARLTPIFRDRDELAAAGDLSEKVRAALAASESLVVICSPESRRSQWVAKEIAAYRELHPDRPILAAIIEGEPEQCFPPGLVDEDAEPLAGDLRPGRDGRRLGLLKIVAGLAGVGLDDLVQRDAARRIRRISWISAVAVAAMLVMALLSVLALDARSEAQRQRAEAEGLVEFMLTDLRTRLRGVGRLDVMNAVNARAMAYYGNAEALRSLPDASLELRARILHARGEDHEKLGDLETALGWFREAHSTTAAILGRHPDDAGAIFAHGQSEFWIGHVHELRQEWPQAGGRYRAYAETAKRLIAIDPDNPDYMMEMGWGAINIGLVEMRGAKRPDLAQPRVEEAIRWFSKAGDKKPIDPSIIRELANAYNVLGETYYVREMWAKAASAYLGQLRSTERLLALDPGDLDTQYRLAIAQRSAARIFLKLGQDGKSAPLLAKAHHAMGRLTNADPGNAEWLLLKTKVDCDLLNLDTAETPVPTDRLRSAISLAARRFRAQGNPRAAEVERCLSKAG